MVQTYRVRPQFYRLSDCSESMARGREEKPWLWLASLIGVVIFAPYGLDNVGFEIQYPDWLTIGLVLIGLVALVLHVYTEWWE